MSSSPAAHIIRVYCLPFIIIIGAAFNLLSFFVMRRIESTTFSFFMSIISVTDTILLFTGALNLWVFAAFNWSIVTTSTITCKLLPFLIYTALDFSILIIINVTAKKMYAILKPLEAIHSKENVKKSVCFALLTLVICSAINSHFLFSQSLNIINVNNNFNKTLIKMCTNDIRWNKFYDYYWPYIDATIYSFLPFILITVFNVLIIKGLLEEAKKSYKLQEKNCSKDALNKTGLSLALKKKNTILKIDKPNVELHSHYSNRRTAVVEFNSKNIFTQLALAIKHDKKVNKGNPKRMTGVIFMINISFIVLTMPIVILQIVNQIYINNKINKLSNLRDESISDSIGQDELSHENIFDLLKAIFEVFQYLNHSINFFLYCFSGQTFRNETKLFLLNFIKILGVCKKN